MDAANTNENPKDVALRIALERRLGLQDVEQVRELLADAVGAFHTVEVDVRDLTHIDISIVQLVVAARRSAEQVGRTLNLVSKPDSVFREILVRAGFLGAAGVCRSEGERFWAGESASSTMVAA